MSVVVDNSAQAASVKSPHGERQGRVGSGRDRKILPVWEFHSLADAVAKARQQHVKQDVVLVRTVDSTPFPLEIARSLASTRIGLVSVSRSFKGVVGHDPELIEAVDAALRQKASVRQPHWKLAAGAAPQRDPAVTAQLTAESLRSPSPSGQEQSDMMASFYKK